nr:hypothetical protein [uncultured Bacteroides sp.]
MSSEVQIWSGPDGVSIPTNVSKVSDIVPFANSLSEKQKNQIIAAFQIEAFDMAAEYAWKKAIMKLKETIGTLGMEFIGEILGREDINEYTPIDSVLTDYTTILLAEQLGVIGNTAALKLRQSQELISHFFSGKADEEFDSISAINIIKNSIQYILSEQDISIAIEFTNFRKRLLSESLKLSDPQVMQLINSPLFYTRTILTILLSSIRKDKGAILEHSLGNINLLLPNTWSNLGESDRWNVGTAYRDVVAEGNSIAANGMKQALLKVNGFDYVPENLRSSTFKNAARIVVETHFAFNNFYNEPSAVKSLANLGSVIPSPALINCIQAYLLVYLGNAYGISIAAASIAHEELTKITTDRWIYYFEKVIQNDDIILLNIRFKNQIDRFGDFLIETGNNNLTNLSKDIQILYNAIIRKQYSTVNKLSILLYNKIKSK